MADIKKDITYRANVKLASLADYVGPALAGGAIAAGATAIPALLNAYANDGDPLKSIANAAQYSAPIGMMLGAGTIPAGKIMQLLTEVLPGHAKALMAKMPSKSDLLDISKTSIKELLTALSPATKGLKTVGNEFKQTGLDVASLIKDLGVEASSIRHF